MPSDKPPVAADKTEPDALALSHNAMLKLKGCLNFHREASIDTIATEVSAEFHRREKIAQDQRAELTRLRGEVERLKEDQSDWRKGVALIASSMGMDTLCCVTINEQSLDNAARLETLAKALEPFSQAALVEDEYGGADAPDSHVVITLGSGPLVKTIRIGDFRQARKALSDWESSRG